MPSRLDNNLDILLSKVSVAPSMKIKVVNESKRSESDQLDEHCTACLAFDLLSKEILSRLCSVRGATTIVMSVRACQAYCSSFVVLNNAILTVSCSKSHYLKI